MASRKAKVLAVAVAGAVLAAAEVALYLCLRLSRPFYLSTAAVLAATVLTLLLLLHCTAGRADRMAARRALDDGEELRAEYSYFRKVAGLPRKFSLHALAAATDDFRCVAGRGASGTVFRGVLDDGTPVAVKRISDDGPGAGRADKEFRAEVSAIAGAQHVNLARLLGFCLGSPRFLVYEYMEHGSLDRWIFPPAGAGDDDGGRPRGCLPWPRRYQVAVDVAKALAYLHHDCRSKVLHLDVKPENILLDDGFRGILSDFGLSKLAGKDQSRVVTAVRGTAGYLAPEWLLGAGVTEKSDVYSYVRDGAAGAGRGAPVRAPGGGRRVVVPAQDRRRDDADGARDGGPGPEARRRRRGGGAGGGAARGARGAVVRAGEGRGAAEHGARAGDAGGEGRRGGGGAAAVGHDHGGPAGARPRALARRRAVPAAVGGPGREGRVVGVGAEQIRLVRHVLPVREIAFPRLHSLVSSSP